MVIHDCRVKISWIPGKYILFIINNLLRHSAALMTASFNLSLFVYPHFLCTTCVDSWLFVPWKKCVWGVVSWSYFTSCPSENTDFRQTRTSRNMTMKSRKHLVRRASHSHKQICRLTLANFLRKSLASRRSFLRDFAVIFLRVLVCLKSVFSDGQDVKYDRDIAPHPHLFHGTNSQEHSAHGDTRLNKIWKWRGRNTQLIVRGMSRLTFVYRLLRRIHQRRSNTAKSKSGLSLWRKSKWGPKGFPVIHPSP